MYRLRSWASLWFPYVSLILPGMHGSYGYGDGVLNEYRRLPADGDLERILVLVRRRLIRWQVTDLLVWWLAFLVAGYLPWRLGGMYFVSWIGVGSLVFVVVAMRRARVLDLMRTARWVESREGGKERLSTALETPEGTSVLAAALHRDARAFARRVEPNAVAPWRWPRRGLTALAIVSSLVIVSMALPNSDVPSFVARQDLAPVLAIEEAERLASVIERVAELRGDPYMQAIAEALQRVVDADRAGYASPEEVDANLQSALEHLSRAFGGAMDGRARADQLLSEEYTAQLDREAAGIQGDYLELGEELFERDSSVSQSEAEVPSPSALSDVPGVGEDAQSAESDGSAQARGEGSSADALNEMAPRPLFDIESQASAGGELVGAADDSEAGESAVAGRGSQGLDGSVTEFALVAEQGELIMLEGMDRDEGRRIEVYVPPAVGTEGAATSQGFAVGPWVAGSEAPMARDVVSQHHREVVGRYLQPSQALRAGTRP